MYTIPQGYIEAARKAVRDEMFGNLRCGGRNNDEYYCVIAAEKIWYCYLERIAEEASGAPLSVGDIRYGCRKAGIEYETNDEHEVVVRMPNSPYWFSGAYFHLYGGPADAQGHYQGYNIEGPEMNLSIRAFLKFLKWFDTLIPSIAAHIHPMVEQLCLEYKQSQVILTSLEPLIESRLRDVELNYACRTENGDSRILFWIFTEDEDNILLEFRHEEFMQNIDLFVKVIRIISEDPSKYDRYPRWARMLDYNDEEWRPDRNFCKEIGII